ncbi:hypothetical protein HYS10_01615 [Candidatus Collierbacteria bacterium]|nr:hypothetical protein [Candidatus Collierbacteria bacterium]
MAKRRTKEQKVKAGFRVEFSSLEKPKKAPEKLKTDAGKLNYFRTDLTKVFILTMLALALEFALWLIWKR